MAALRCCGTPSLIRSTGGGDDGSATGDASTAIASFDIAGSRDALNGEAQLNLVEFDVAAIARNAVGGAPPNT